VISHSDYTLYHPEGWSPPARHGCNEVLRQKERCAAQLDARHNSSDIDVHNISYLDERCASCQYMRVFICDG
jgi:hypothetical protein